MNNIELAAEFILTVPPLEEITDVFYDVTERFRNSMLTKKEAIEELISYNRNELNKFHENNFKINEECMRCITQTL